MRPVKLAILGATGKLGRVLTARALEAGHEVRAFVRDPDKLGDLRDRVEAVVGDLSDPASLERAIDGVDAVVSCLGPTKLDAGQVALFEAGTQAIVEAMKAHGVRRIVAVSGGAARLPTDRRSLANRLLIGVMRTMAGTIVEANERVLAVLAGSGLEWVAARSGNMTGGPGGEPVRADAHIPPGWKIARVDLADFMLAQLESDAWVGQAPFVMT